MDEPQQPGSDSAGNEKTGASSGTQFPPDLRKQAFDFAADATKQLITVSTGVIAATVIFSKDLDTTSRYLALASWVILILSVVFGLGALLSMTGNLHNSILRSMLPSLSDDIHLLSKLQIGSFLLGIVLVMIFGFFAAGIKPPPDKPTTINCIVPNPPAPVIVQVPAPSVRSDSGVKHASGKNSTRSKRKNH